MGIGARQGQHPVDPFDGVGEAIARSPIGTERGHKAERQLGVPAVDGPRESRAEIVALRVERGSVSPAVATPQRPVGAVAFGDGEEVLGVALAHDLGVGPRHEPLAGVRAHRFEHREAGRLVRPRAAHQEALGDEAVERVEVGAGDGLRGVDGGAAREDGEPGEERLLVVASSSWLQSIVARSVRWRAGASPGPAPRTRCRRVEPLGDLGR